MVTELLCCLLRWSADPSDQTIHPATKYIGLGALTAPALSILGMNAEAFRAILGKNIQ